MRKEADRGLLAYWLGQRCEATRAVASSLLRIESVWHMETLLSARSHGFVRLTGAGLQVHFTAIASISSVPGNSLLHDLHDAQQANSVSFLVQGFRSSNPIRGIVTFVVPCVEDRLLVRCHRPARRSAAQFEMHAKQTSPPRRRRQDDPDEPTECAPARPGSPVLFAIAQSPSAVSRLLFQSTTRPHAAVLP